MVALNSAPGPRVDYVGGLSSSGEGSSKCWVPTSERLSTWTADGDKSSGKEQTMRAVAKKTSGNSS